MGYEFMALMSVCCGCGLWLLLGPTYFLDQRLCAEGRGAPVGRIVDEEDPARLPDHLMAARSGLECGSVEYLTQGPRFLKVTCHGLLTKHVQPAPHRLGRHLIEQIRKCINSFDFDFSKKNWRGM